MDSPDTLTLTAIALLCALATFYYGRRIFAGRAAQLVDRSAPLAPPPPPLSAEKRQALNAVYHEQIRRLIDVKVDVIRNASQTQNQILLMQAEAICQRLSQGAAAAGAEETDTLPLARQIVESRAESTRQLAQIDQQIRSVATALLD